MASVQLKITGGQVVPEITMPRTASVLELKQRIAEVLDVEVGRQKLWFNDLWLTDHYPIDFYGFESPTEIELSVSSIDQSKFNIVARRSSDTEANFRVRETQTVRHLRRKIVKRWAIPNEFLTLIRLNKEMDNDDLPLSAYYINEGSEVQVIAQFDPR